MEKNELSIIENSIVMPAVSGEQAIEAWKQYQDLKNKIIDKDQDIQHIQGKDFLKKSYWRKVTTFFNLSVEVVEEKREQVGKTFVWHFTCKAIAPNGRFAIGTGSCDAYEKAILKDGKYLSKGRVTVWGKTPDGKSFPQEWDWTDATPNSIHNIRSTAETRAFNRAVSNLVGGGEVSAEEVNSNTNTGGGGATSNSIGVQQANAVSGEHLCTIHNKQMKERIDKTPHYFDHRWQANGAWQQCNGQPNEASSDYPYEETVH